MCRLVDTVFVLNAVTTVPFVIAVCYRKGVYRSYTRPYSQDGRPVQWTSRFPHLPFIWWWHWFWVCIASNGKTFSGFSKEKQTHLFYLPSPTGRSLTVINLR